MAASGAVSAQRAGADRYVCQRRKAHPMNALFLFLGWCILLVLCWPLALLALVVAPLVWLLALPFRLAGICVGAVFALLKALLFLPARALGYRG